MSIRDICAEVGIKESTVYYYFKNKQSVFDELMAEFEEITSAVQNNFNLEFARITKVEEDAFILVGLSILNRYLLSEKILKLFRMLMIEQHSSGEAAEILRRALFENPLQQHEMVFEAMLAKGYFHDGEPKAMAVEYYAPIILAFQRYFSCGDITEENKQEADALLTTHLANFYKRYAVSAKEE